MYVVMLVLKSHFTFHSCIGDAATFHAGLYISTSHSTSARHIARHALCSTGADALLRVSGKYTGWVEQGFCAATGAYKDERRFIIMIIDILSSSPSSSLCHWPLTICHPRPLHHHHVSSSQMQLAVSFYTQAKQASYTTPNKE
eukprot:1161235-Pelagomonas_calceolata.AAC.10